MNELKSERYAVFARLFNDDLEQVSAWMTLESVKTYYKNNERGDPHYSWYIFKDITLDLYYANT
jgi:hypothetical protein